MYNFTNRFNRSNLVLAIGFAAILLLLLLLTTHAMERVEELNQHIQRVVKEYNQKASLLQTMRHLARERIFNIHHMLLVDDPFEQDEYAMEIDEFGAKFADNRKQLLALSLSDHEKRLLDIQGKMAQQSVPLQRRAVAAIQSGNHEQAKELLLNEVIPLQHRVLATLSHLESMQAKAIEETVQKAEQQHTTTRKNLLIIGSSALLLGIAIFTFSLMLAKRLSHLAHHDPLTGINNRRGFEIHLGELLQQSDEQEKGYLCVLDLDHFKQVNDECGHAAGDILLCKLVDKMSESIRHRDVIARLGGDEFAIILKECPLDQTQRITDNIRNNVDGYRFNCEGKDFQVGISIGLVAVTSKYTVTELVSMADEACYSAKDHGRNQICINTGSPHRARIGTFTPVDQGDDSE